MEPLFRSRSAAAHRPGWEVHTPAFSFVDGVTALDLAEARRVERAQGSYGGSSRRWRVHIHGRQSSGAALVDVFSAVFISRVSSATLPKALWRWSSFGPGESGDGSPWPPVVADGDEGFWRNGAAKVLGACLQFLCVLGAFVRILRNVSIFVRVLVRYP